MTPLLLCFDVKNGQILGPTSFNIMHESADKNEKNLTRLEDLVPSVGIGGVLIFGFTIGEVFIVLLWRWF
jgi:hypothetical protein